MQLELLKAALVRLSAAQAFSDDRELRLMDRVDDDLVFAWLDPADGALQQDFRVPEQACRDIAAQPDWAPLREELAASRFVDLNRLFMPAD